MKLLISIGGWVGIGVAAVLVLAVIIWIIATFNKFVGMGTNCDESFSTVDIYLKKRYDLIPNIVETVKGYAKHESETLENVIKARNTFLSATTPDTEMEADGELTKAITKLFALTESYPELKANTNFIELQTELRQTEEKIASSRQFYNDTVLTYNNKIEVIPTNIVASLFNFKREAFFEAQEKERENVQVKF